MPSTYVFTTSPYTRDQVPLGSIVPDVKYPNEEAFVSRLADDESHVPHENSDISAHVNEESQGYLQGTLTAVWRKICSIFWGVERSRDFTITADAGHTYSLTAPKAFLARLLSDEHPDSQRLREFLKDLHDERIRPVLIVEYRTLINPRLVQHDRNTSAISAGGQVIAGDVSTGPTGAQLLSGHEHTTGQSLALQMNGERIFAIRYRVIKVKIIRNEMVAYLGRSNSNHWRIFPQTRGEQAEEIEIMEALLEESDFVEEGEQFQGDEETFVQLVADNED